MIDYKYCPQCKTDLDPSGEYPHCPKCNITIYKNSIPCVGILPIKDGKVLLSKRAIEPFKGEYSIIGGILDDGEDPIEGIKRETQEETGLTVEPIEILGIYMDHYHDGRFTLNIHYIGKVISGELKINSENESLDWIKISEVSTEEGFDNDKEALKDLKNWYSRKKNKL